VYPGSLRHLILSLQRSDGEANQTYPFSEKNIAWSGEAKKYTNNPAGQPSDFLPPPNWSKRYPSPYETFPQLADDEHFQVWMRTAALPTFKKLWGRNDDNTMVSGTYNIQILMSELCDASAGGWSYKFAEGPR
jgi:hypothetical protein